MIPFLPTNQQRILSLMPTYQCTASCANCGTLSHPKERTKLSKDQIKAAIDDAAANSYKMVVFTGGEATLSRNLFENIGYATSLGLATRLVTNGWWGKFPKLLKKMIANLKDAGLNELNLSTGDEHARFVSVETVANCAYTAVEAELFTAVMIEVRETRNITEATFRAMAKIQDLLAMFPSRLFRVIESPWMPLDGHIFESYPTGHLVNKSNILARGGCDSILKTTTIQATGQISACCGIGMRLIPELQLGHLGEISLTEADHSADNDFLKRWLRVEGPEKILEWASEHDSEIKWEDMYAHRCQACIRLYNDARVRNVIKERYEEKVPDVLFSEWLLFNYKEEDNSKIQAISDD